jgi:hypothetical protein
MIGQTVSHNRVLTKLGSDGMGSRARRHHGPRHLMLVKGFSW